MKYLVATVRALLFALSVVLAWLSNAAEWLSEKAISGWEKLR